MLVAQVTENVRDCQKRIQYLESELARLTQAAPETHGTSGKPDHSSGRNVGGNGSGSVSVSGVAVGANGGLNSSKELSALVTKPSLRLNTNFGIDHELNGISMQQQSTGGVVKEVDYPQKVLEKQSSSILDRVLNRFGVKGGGSAVTPLPQQKKSEFIATIPFDNWKSESALTTGKIVHKLQEIGYRVDVEQKVKAGTDRLHYVLAASTDNSKDRRLQVEEKLAECTGKLNLLLKAQQRYQNLYFGDSSSIADDDPSNKPTRKPFSGKLSLFLIGASGLVNKASPRSDAYASIKIDGVQRVKTKNAPVMWQEKFEIQLDRAQEVEICIYEKSGGLLALMWFKLSELEESLRLEKQRISNHGVGFGEDIGATMIQDRMGGDGVVGGSASDRSAESRISVEDGVEYLLDMEPGGQLSLKIDLNVATTPTLGRQRKEGVARQRPVQKFVPTKGHKLVPMQFYQVMKCAVCSELLISGQGYQCQSCKYTCHKSCQDRIMPKCITTGDIDKDNQDELLKHRIPHRFELTSSMGANWCCHCGYILPLGKRQSMKCSECAATVHKECAHLVPHFCGLTPALIGQLRSAIGQAEKMKKEKLSLLKMKEDKERTMSYGITPIDEDRPHQQQQSLQFFNQDEVFHTTQSMQHIQLHQNSLFVSDKSPTSLPSTPTTPATVSQPSSQLPLTPVSGEAKGSNTQLVPETTDAPPPPPLQQQQKISSGVIIPSRKGSVTAVPAITTPSKRKSPRGIGLDDFSFLAVLGKGNFGKVMLAEEKATKKLYAIKVLKKEFIIENDEVESTKSEKRVFLTANKEQHPFLVNLHSCFQTESRIYFVMEYVSGGDLMWHIQHQQFSESRAKYYACEVLLSLEYFHKNNIVYRDLKLDNILLSLDGHIKIADYGLCKEGMSYGAETSTFCGTPEFMAPEILLEKPYTRAVDWWALGVLIYEMLLGKSPFRGDDEDEIFEAILQDEVKFPPNMPEEAMSVLQMLLTKDPARRLGAGPTDSEEIKQHPYFAGIDFKALIELKIPPPFFPTVSSSTDVSNFDSEFTKEMPVLTPCTSVLSTADQEEFRGFTYISDLAKTTRSKPKTHNSSSMPMATTTQATSS